MKESGSSTGVGFISVEKNVSSLQSLKNGQKNMMDLRVVKYMGNGLIASSVHIHAHALDP